MSYIGMPAAATSRSVHSDAPSSSGVRSPGGAGVLGGANAMRPLDTGPTGSVGQTLVPVRPENEWDEEAPFSSDRTVVAVSPSVRTR
ncbi:hypothetical protein GCM10014719_19010 [Planomonospora parontospora subsp. antibiotica]|nr:hypothetical protein GCM10014719_19010 [Planomonospora parontospora subsp. antibiotica]GII15288.1 hypothetical protein Ppa05_20140 [Planomonospora parontospora subsp. antibiotica]